MEDNKAVTEGVRSKAYDVQVNERFMIVMDRLEKLGKIKNLFNFCAIHNLHYPNYHRLKKEKSRTPSFYIVNLVAEKYGVSVEWILTGKGEWLMKGI